ncbi:MAG: biopolymer transporter ExbD [Bacteroidetes bacterium]|nr:MAG: biopolymer transporter ExbD [Bacteroidota bacterium]
MTRETPEVSAGSMADVAFLLLIFFLVTTTMAVDSGIMRKLPPPVPDDIKAPPVKTRNVFQVLINSADAIMISDKTAQSASAMKEANKKDLRRLVKDFLTPHVPDNPKYPETKVVDIDFIGKYEKSKGIVSMQNDRGTSYNTYIFVQNELAAAVRELRDELANQYFGMDFNVLLKTDEAKAKAIQKAVPMAISEAEPVNFGGK